MSSLRFPTAFASNQDPRNQILHSIMRPQSSSSSSSSSQSQQQQSQPLQQRVSLISQQQQGQSQQPLQSHQNSTSYSSERLRIVIPSPRNNPTAALGQILSNNSSFGQQVSNRQKSNQSAHVLTPQQQQQQQQQQLHHQNSFHHQQQQQQQQQYAMRSSHSSTSNLLKNILDTSLNAQNNNNNNSLINSANNTGTGFHTNQTLLSQRKPSLADTSNGNISSQQLHANTLTQQQNSSTNNANNTNNNNTNAFLVNPLIPKHLPRANGISQTNSANSGQKNRAVSRDQQPQVPLSHTGQAQEQQYQQQQRLSSQALTISPQQLKYSTQPISSSNQNINGKSQQQQSQQLNASLNNSHHGDIRQSIQAPEYIVAQGSTRNFERNRSPDSNIQHYKQQQTHPAESLLSTTAKKSTTLTDLDSNRGDMLHSVEKHLKTLPVNQFNIKQQQQQQQQQPPSTTSQQTTVPAHSSSVQQNNNTLPQQNVQARQYQSLRQPYQSPNQIAASGSPAMSQNNSQISPNQSSRTSLVSQRAQSQNIHSNSQLQQLDSRQQQQYNLAGGYGSNQTIPAAAAPTLAHQYSNEHLLLRQQPQSKIEKELQQQLSSSIAIQKDLEKKIKMLIQQNERLEIQGGISAAAGTNGSASTPSNQQTGQESAAASPQVNNISQQQLLQIREERDALKQENAQLKNKLKDQQLNSTSDQMDILLNLESRMQELIAENDRINSLLTSKDAAALNTQESIQQAIDVKQIETKYEEKIARLEKENFDMKKQVLDLRTRLTLEEQKVSKINRQVADFDTKIKALHEENDKLNNLLESATNKFGGQQEAAIESTNNEAVYQAKILQLEEQITKLKYDNKELNEESEILRAAQKLKTYENYATSLNLSHRYSIGSSVQPSSVPFLQPATSTTTTSYQRSYQQK